MTFCALQHKYAGWRGSCVFSENSKFLKVLSSGSFLSCFLENVHPAPLGFECVSATMVGGMFSFLPSHSEPGTLLRWLYKSEPHTPWPDVEFDFEWARCMLRPNPPIWHVYSEAQIRFRTQRTDQNEHRVNGFYAYFCVIQITTLW